MPPSAGAGADDEVRATVCAVWRIESARLIGALTRRVRDLGVAEQLAQDALVAALEHWPREGVPDNPAAWLMATARNLALDHLRRQQVRAAQESALSHALDLRHAIAAQAQAQAVDDALDDTVGDDLLRLIFTACHPVLSAQARVALALRVLGGLGTDEIARSFLVPEATIAQRIVRAKRSLAEARVPFEVPPAGELPQRLGAVLEVIYLVFNEGYAATSGGDWMRPALCEEAMRLGRVLARLMPYEPEVHGLVALMELQASRNAARVGPGGEPVLLLAQVRSRWDRLLIGRGLAALANAEKLAAGRGQALGPYALQAAIAACHARAADASATDWPRIVALYDALVEVTGSPVVELNRAVAVSMAFGASTALPLVEALADEPALRHYHLLPAVRADLLARLGRLDEAAAEFERAAALTRNERERQVLAARAHQCRPPGADRGPAALH
ncbi:RNA polymerase sigma factor [Variovorax sp.]|uniref:RNA polymerase sigma factor n=1 Tax=Variovorax sp. TaxID=1871043 RepID=UPI002D4EE56C|nr:RNA polymerase sigma factor [Variovorax sp.]HYP85585.1 RNA polymerase sigma factor [Variovorax sp.]